MFETIRTTGIAILGAAILSTLAVTAAVGPARAEGPSTVVDASSKPVGPLPFGKAM
jgi:hypothetical protein